MSTIVMELPGTQTRTSTCKQMIHVGHKIETGDKIARGEQIRIEEKGGSVYFALFRQWTNHLNPEKRKLVVHRLETDYDAVVTVNQRVHDCYLDDGGRRTRPC